jgi:hypoxanthine phosphoribosyltransferase
MRGSDMGNAYTYEQRKGVLLISWEEYFGLCKGLALAVAAYHPEIILGVARGGLYVATLLAHLLQSELYVIRVTRRYRDRVVYDEPAWLVRPPTLVEERRVLIADEICGVGETLTMIKDEVARLGAAEVRSAVLCSHERGKAIPDYIGVVSDALIVNPWDREIIQDGRFVNHPEYVHALAQQGLGPDVFPLLGIDPRPPAKG